VDTVAQIIRLLPGTQLSEFTIANVDLQQIVRAMTTAYTQRNPPVLEKLWIAPDFDSMVEPGDFRDFLQVVSSSPLIWLILYRFHVNGPVPENSISETSELRHVILKGCIYDDSSLATALARAPVLEHIFISGLDELSSDDAIVGLLQLYKKRGLLELGIQIKRPRADVLRAIVRVLEAPSTVTTLKLDLGALRISTGVLVGILRALKENNPGLRHLELGVAGVVSPDLNVIKPFIRQYETFSMHTDVIPAEFAVGLAEFMAFPVNAR
jgi:hypothetical protein